MRIEDVLSQKQLIDYVKAYPVEPGGLEALFPTRRVDDFEADFIKGAYNKAVMADMYAYDTPTELGQRYGVEKGTLSLYLIKEKMKLDEREIMRLERPRSDMEFQSSVRLIYNDVDQIRQRIENRIDWMRYQVIQTGKLEYKNNGLEVKIDYGLDVKEQKGDLNWSTDTTDVLNDIFNICDKTYRRTGFPIEHILMSQKWLYTLLKNKTIRSAILGTEKDKFITPAELNSNLSAMGLPTISVDERRVASEKVVKGKLVKSYDKLLAEDTILFLPGGKLGETIRGLTPEGEGLRGSPIAQIETAGETIITHYQEVDPVAHYVKGSASAGVTFPYAEQIYIGTAK